MKKAISLLLSAFMVVSCIGGINFNAYAGDYTTLATDVQLNTGQTIERVRADGIDDWYRINILSDGKFSLKVCSYYHSYVAIYNDDLTKQFSDEYIFGDEITPKTQTIDLVLSSGTYYIKISAWDNTGAYKLSFTFASYNVNDLNANSYDCPFILASNTVITGALTETDIEDWYKIKIPSSATYSISFVSRLPYCRIEVFNENLTSTIQRGDVWAQESTPNTAINNITLSKGTYYIKIFGGCTGLYNISWSPLTKDNCNHELTSSIVVQSYVAKGYTLHKCKICGYSYKDNYTAKYKLPKPTINQNKTKAGKKKITVSYTSVYNATGYQIQYSTSKKFTEKTTKTVNTKNCSKTIKNLKGKKKYYIRVRAYITENGKKAYSSWSDKKTITTKK